MDLKNILAKLDSGGASDSEKEEIEHFISDLLKGDFFSKSDEKLEKIMALTLDRRLSKEKDQKYKWAFDILQLRNTERLVTETKRLSEITWGLAIATWFLAILNIILMAIGK